MIRMPLPHAILALAMALCSTLAAASDADNILACAKAAHDYAGVTPDPHEAAYQGRFLAFSEATWTTPAVRCEVKLGTVYNLLVNERFALREGYAGDEAWKAAERIDEVSEQAIGKLQARISLMRKARDDAKEKLRQPAPDIDATFRGFAQEGTRALSSIPLPGTP